MLNCAENHDYKKSTQQSNLLKTLIKQHQHALERLVLLKSPFNPISYIYQEEKRDLMTEFPRLMAD